MALTLLCPGRVSPWILPLLVLAVAGDPEAQPLPPLDADPVETMSLAQAQAALDQANPDLASASAAIDDAQAVAHQSLAAIKPVVTASATYLRNNTDATLDLSQAFAGLAQSIAQATMQPVDLGVSGGETIIQPLQSLSANAQVVVPLFAAGAYANIKAAKASARSAAATRDATLAQLHGGLHQTAWLAAAAEALVGVSERAVSNAAAHVQRTQRMRDLGTATQLSVDQAELAWMQRRSDLLTARGALAGMQVSLGVMLGRPAAVKIVLPDAPVNADMNADTTAQDEMVRQALRARPELTAARADEQAARLRLKSARLAYAPTLAATMTANGSTAPYVTGLHYGWQAGLSLQWTLYAGGSRRGTKQRAEAGLRQAAARTHRVELQIWQEVVDAARELRLAHARVALAEEESVVAQSAAQSAGRTFELGGGTSADVLDALDSAFQADIRRVEARARAAAAQSQLRVATSGRTRVEVTSLDTTAGRALQ